MEPSDLYIDEVKQHSKPMCCIDVDQQHTIIFFKGISHTNIGKCLTIILCMMEFDK